MHIHYIRQFSKKYLGHPFENKNRKTLTDEVSNILTKSKRKAIKTESDGGAECYNSIFQNFLRGKNILPYGTFNDKGSNIAERLVRTIRSLLKKPIFLKGNADWLSELPSVINLYNNTIHSTMKLKPIDASRKSEEKIVFNNLKDEA